MDDTLGGLGEREVLRRILPILPRAQAALLGAGDDAAVLSAPDARFVVTTDLMVEGPDFRLAWSRPHDLGWKAAASNLADVAAMGAVPTALVVALAAPVHTPIALLLGIAEGLRDGCAALAPGCGVVGGDLSVSEVVTLAVTAFGDLQGRAPVLRSGAKEGDVVAVSGALGAAAEGLRVLFSEAMVDGEPSRERAEALRERVVAQLAPHPPIADGVAAALAGATAMLDISDGLSLDASRLAEASGAAIHLSSELLAGAGARSLPAALDGGEDHSLLAVFPAGTVLPGGFRRIGHVASGAGVFVDGEPYAPRGWDPYL